jgi:FXSXX-COOH protein
MDSTPDRRVEIDDEAPGLLDVRGLSLHDVTTAKHWAIETAMRRLLDDLTESREIIAAFANVPHAPQ